MKKRDLNRSVKIIMTFSNCSFPIIQPLKTNKKNWISVKNNKLRSERKPQNGTPKRNYVLFPKFSRATPSEGIIPMATSQEATSHVDSNGSTRLPWHALATAFDPLDNTC